MDNVNNIPETLQNVFQNVKHKGHGGKIKHVIFIHCSLTHIWLPAATMKKVKKQHNNNRVYVSMPFSEVDPGKQ